MKCEDCDKGGMTLHLDDSNRDWLCCTCLFKRRGVIPYG